MKLRSIVFALAIALPATVFATERGVIGVSMAIDSEGSFLSPTLRSIKIVMVIPESPAALAGIKAGDEVIEVAGRLVAGAKAREIQALAEKDVGQSLNLKVRHSEGGVAAITMVAVERLAPK